MKGIYFCTTPFQVMTCIALNKNRTGKLVIIDKFTGSLELCNKVKSLEVFDDVCLIDDSQIWSGKTNSWLGLRIKTIRSYIKYRDLVEKFFPDINNYSDVFVSSRQQVNRLVCMYVAQRRPCVNIHFFDDGLGSYSKSVTETNMIDKIFRYILVGAKAASFKYQLHLYSPGMYRSYNDNNEEIKKITLDDSVISVMGELFCVKNSNKYNKILFDTIPQDEFDKNGQNIYKELVNIILKDSDVVVKQHPRNRDLNCVLRKFENSSIPFEVLLSINDYSDTVFFTSFSTAVFTPKLIYDQEPTIVFLYKIMKPYRRDKKQDCEKIVRCMEKMYRAPEKILIPQNKYELKRICQEITLKYGSCS